MTELSHVWVVRTSMRDLHGWYYVGVETESEARGLVGKKRQGETIMSAKHIRNVEHVKAHELRPVPIGNRSPISKRFAPCIVEDPQFTPCLRRHRTPQFLKLDCEFL